MVRLRTAALQVLIRNASFRVHTDIQTHKARATRAGVCARLHSSLVPRPAACPPRPVPRARSSPRLSRRRYHVICMQVSILHASAGNPGTAFSDSHTYIAIVRGHQNIPISIHIHTVRTYGTYIHTYDICTFESPVDSGYSYVHWGWAPSDVARYSDTNPHSEHGITISMPSRYVYAYGERRRRDHIRLGDCSVIGTGTGTDTGDLSATPHNLQPGNRHKKRA